MEEQKKTKTYQELPDTLKPKDYAEWRGCGEGTAYDVFNSKGFPLIQRCRCEETS